jgi:ArsR family transcriptional regulator
MDNNIKKNCSSCFGALGESARTKIVQRLKKGEATVSEIAADFSLTQPTISHHLRALKELNMVKAKKTGREVHYSLNKKCLCKKCDLFNLPFRT